MAALRFATTRLSGLRAAGRLQEMQHATIAPFLERELGPAYGRLFADFEAESSDVRAWYADAATAPRRIDTLPQADQEALRQRLAQMIADVLKLAERISGESTQKANVARVLTAATTFPEEDIWAADGQPIIVNWGFHRLNIAAGVPRPIMMRIERLAAETTFARPQQTGPLAQAPDVAVAAAVLPRRRAIPAWLVALLLWLAFVAMVAFAYRLLLPACALRGSLFSVLDTCPAGARRTTLADEGRELQGLVDQAELDLARRRGLCVAPQPTAFSPAPRPVPATPEMRHDIELRLPPQAPHGDVEVSLLWNNSADLDLIIDCPSGERLWRASPNLSACGGRLMSDLNRAGQPLIENPIERAAWPHSPGGSFAIKVELYAYNNAPDGIEIPFTIAIKRSSGTEIVQGRIQGAHSMITATTADL